MSSLRFEWDEAMNRSNRRKHGISFEEETRSFASSRLAKRTGTNSSNTSGAPIRKHYDFSKSVRNPYLSKAKKQLTIRLDEDTIKYFKALAEQNGIP